MPDGRRESHAMFIRTIAIATLAVMVPAGAPAIRPRAQATGPKIATLGKVSGTCTFDKTHTLQFLDGVAIPGHLYLNNRPATQVLLADFPMGAFQPDRSEEHTSELQSPC